MHEITMKYFTEILFRNKYRYTVKKIKSKVYSICFSTPANYADIKKKSYYTMMVMAIIGNITRRDVQKI